MFSTDNRSEQTENKLMQPSVLDKQTINRITDTYKHVAGGLCVTGLSALICVGTGVADYLLTLDPTTYFIGTLGVTIPLIVSTVYTDYTLYPTLKYANYAGLLITQGTSLSILGCYGGPLVIQALVGTGCVFGGLSAFALNSQLGKFDIYRGALYTGLGLIAAAAVSNVFWPMPLLHSMSVYGGLVVFSGLTLLDTQDMIKNAKSDDKYDPINESLNIYLNSLNIFVRLHSLLRKYNMS
jgi:FtsH-binding integral membrane protein